MRCFIAFMIVLGCWTFVVGQSGQQSISRAEEVRAALEKASISGEISISGVLFDMRTFEGKLFRMDDDSFMVVSKRRSSLSIKYGQVLELNGGGIAISYFPDPDLSPFADWTAVKKLTYGDRLEIDQIEGTDIVGVLLRVSDTGLTLVDGNRTREVKQDAVKRIFLARLETHSVVKALKGAAKGAGSVGRSNNSSIGAAAVNGAIMVGAATAGAIGAVARRFPNDRLLIYAK